MKRFIDICVELGTSILTALMQMDATHRKLLFVTKDGQYHNLLSSGDIQRTILKGVALTIPVEENLRAETNVASVHQRRVEVEQYVREYKTEFMPIINSWLVDVVFGDEYYKYIFK